jgi:hypothetical protein
VRPAVPTSNPSTMKSKAKKVKTGRVVTIGLSRLFNTGNYTNLKIDLTCQIEKGESAASTLIEMGRLIHSLRPIRKPDCLEQLRIVRTKKLSDRSEYEKAHFGDWLRLEAEYKRDLSARNQAIEDMDRLGGVATQIDHKLSWDSDDQPW